VVALSPITMFNFAMLTFRGGAHYNLYHHYADKGAMFDFVAKLGLTTPPMPRRAPEPARLARLHRARHARESPSNVADVFNSIVNMVGIGTTIVVIILSAGLFQTVWQEGRDLLSASPLAALNSFAYYC
jgi:GPH family glycoside/pentoside/hexuronide:cation symporter